MRAIWLTERRSREVFESGCKEKQDGFNRKILNSQKTKSQPSPSKGFGLLGSKPPAASSTVKS